MSYLREVLQPGETVRFHTNVHWFVYLKAIAAFLIALVFLIWFALSDPSSPVLLVVALIFALIGAVLFVPAWLRRLGTEVAVTDRRVIYKTGLMRRHSIEINMDKVESVDVDQSILGRLFGYGSITIRGTGESIEPLWGIAHPIEFRNHVLVR